MNRRTNHYRWLIPATLLLIGLASCGGPTEEETTPETDAAALAAFTPIVSATGEVVPKQWAALSLPTAGVVEELTVEVGDMVTGGSLLTGLSGREQLEAAVSTANLEFVNARQALESLIENADLTRAEAEQALASARDALKDAEYDWRVNQQGFRATGETIKRNEAELVLADQDREAAESAYNRLSGRPTDDPGRALARTHLASARERYDAVLRRLNWYTGHPTELQQSMLDADVAVAQAQVAEAERAVERSQAGPDVRALETGEARLKNAEMQLKAAQAAVADHELYSPFDGTVSEVSVRLNEWVNPGQPFILVGNLDELQVETTDLSEIDASRVRIGDPVSVTFDALSDVVSNGTIVRIYPKAAEGSGVNFTVIVELDEISEGLRWGMTAFVDIEVEE